MSDSLNREHKNLEISIFGLFCLVLLVIAVMSTALGVIVSAFENRRHLAELEALRADARDMQVLGGQYLVEKSTWAAYGRVLVSGASCGSSGINESRISGEARRGAHGAH